MHENRLDQRIKKYKTMMELGREQLAETRKTNSSRIRQKSTIEKNKAKFSLFKGFMMTEMLQGAVQTIEADRTRVRGWVNQMVTKHHDLMNETTSYDDDIEATGTMGGLRRLYGRIGGESPGDFWLFVDHYIDGLLLLEQTMLYTKNVYITTIYRRLVAALRVMHGKYNVLLYMSGMTNVSGDDLIQFGGRIGMEIQNEYDRISIPKIDEEKWAQIVSGEK
ncbi:hypothetical protein ECANGB1_1334 [Enterospora canceri]|uniref:Uncharacterized protein n=1 Tax=Enterospora canceri TaxID=1081671 RepID=A0A1Y1S4N1_9MICR|nr:hypothetical protein ECANGB1_1334 [Enterospora canceri]